ncbi:MAG: hypothetical protein UU96_C0018G0009 [Parcubacteria group bacterium GW2011_GWC2_42_13]|nr:MAG: hypothetical protein UU96_C0018G0009 [Parcubacteria group bacterium GW2011_GWC2_42_13]
MFTLWWAVSSVGRAPHLHCGGREFESPTVHNISKGVHYSHKEKDASR